jgi:hypothetical protein
MKWIKRHIINILVWWSDDRNLTPYVNTRFRFQIIIKSKFDIHYVYYNNQRSFDLFRNIGLKKLINFSGNLESERRVSLKSIEAEM